MLYDILWPVVSVGGLALIFALLLGFASKKFAVEKDETAELILEELPGANCGGCGFPGCAGLADAIAAGKEKPNACPVCNDEQVQAIAKITGVDASTSEKKIARVRCVGGDSCKDKFHYEGLKTCVAQHALGANRKACSAACMGLGSCVEACKFGAMRMNENGVAEVDPEKCTGCLACFNLCPRQCIEMIPISKTVFPACRNMVKGKAVREMCATGCVACGLCAKVCKQDAIVMTENLPLFNYTRCTACGDCAAKCPAKCITAPAREAEAKEA